MISYAFRRSVERVVARFFAAVGGHSHDGSEGQGPKVPVANVDGLGVWADWTPTVTQSGNVAVTVTRARYRVIGKSCRLEVRLAVTGAGGGATAVALSVPAQAAAGLYRSIGSFAFWNGAAYVLAHAWLESTTSIQFIVPTGYYSTQLANGHSISGEGEYEIA